MAVQVEGSSGVIQEVDLLWQAGRVSSRPFEALGYYEIGIVSGLYAGLVANSILYSYRWGDATRFAIINKLVLSVVSHAGYTAAQRIDRDLTIVRGFTASDTGGTAIVLTGSNNLKRTSFGTSLVTDFRVTAGAALAVGTGTADVNATGLAMGWALAGAAGLHITPIDMISPDCPVILKQNEGFRIYLRTAQGAGGVSATQINLSWAEVNSF